MIERLKIIIGCVVEPFLSAVARVDAALDFEDGALIGGGHASSADYQIVQAQAITRVRWTDDDGTGETGTIINNAALGLIASDEPAAMVTTTESAYPSEAAVESLSADDQQRMSDGGHERDHLKRRCRLCGATDRDLWDGKVHQFFCAPGSREKWRRDQETQTATEKQDADRAAAEAARMVGKTRKIVLGDE